MCLISWNINIAFDWDDFNQKFEKVFLFWWACWKYGSWLDAVWENVAKLTTSYLAGSTTRWRTYQQFSSVVEGGKTSTLTSTVKKSELTLHLFSLFFYGLVWQVSSKSRRSNVNDVNEWRILKNPGTCSIMKTEMPELKWNGISPHFRPLSCSNFNIPSGQSKKLSQNFCDVT